MCVHRGRSDQNQERQMPVPPPRLALHSHQLESLCLLDCLAIGSKSNTRVCVRFEPRSVITWGGVLQYPFEKVIQKTRDYFISSITYMLSHAISMEPDEIALYGVDLMPDEEWDYQRACTEYLLGLAEGRGIKITIPEGSALRKFQSQPVRFGASFIKY